MERNRTLGSDSVYGFLACLVSVSCFSYSYVGRLVGCPVVHSFMQPAPRFLATELEQSDGLAM